MPTHNYTYISSDITATGYGRQLGISVSMCKLVFLMIVLWIGFLPWLASAQVTLSGTVYSDAGVTAQAVSKTIKVAVGTSTPGVFSTTSVTTTGTWTITIPAGHAISTSTPILVWIDNDVTTRGEVLTKSSSSQAVFSITGLDIYKDRAIIRHEASSGTSTTNTDFAFYTSANDSDVQHSTSTGLLTFAPGNELYIWGSKTFAPGGGVTVQGNALSSSTDGSMYIATSSVYTAGGTLTLGGTFRAASTATFTPGVFTTLFNATTTGKTISAPLTTLGNVTFNGVGGGWTFTSAATTSALTILRGTVTAPNSTLGVTGTFQNDATFSHNGGTVNIVGAATVALSDIALFANGLDVSGSATGILSQNITSFLTVGTTLYVGQAGVGTACSNTAGSAQGCELLIFNVSSTSNPTFVAGRDSNGSGVGTSTIGITNLVVASTTLYAVKGASATACAQVAGGAIGCELIVFDISSTTNPNFVAGRDADGSLAGTTNIAGTGLAASGTALYMSKAAAGIANCSTTASNCEVLVFNISSTTNPQYVYGLDSSGSNTGILSVGVNNMTVSGGALYVVKAALGTACSQTTGSAQGCELMVFSISSTTQPVYTRGVDVNGSQTGTGNLAINTLLASGTALYLGAAASSSGCTQITGSIEGCELQMYDIASTTDPVFRRGVDVAGSYTGRQSLGVNNFALIDNYLYVAKAGNATPCVQARGFTLGCELLIFDVASSSAIRLLGARDADGSATGTTAIAGNAVVPIGQSVILGKAAAGTGNCSTARLNCELMIFSASTTPKGFLFGTLSGTSTLGNVVTSGSIEFKDDASVTQLTIASGTTTAPSYLTVLGDYTNNGILLAGEGTMDFASSANQILSGTLTGTSSFYRLKFSGVGTTTISANASTSFIDINASTKVVAPAQLTVADTFSNNGTFVNNNGTLITNGFLNSFITGLSVGGTATDTVGTTINAFAQKGNALYVAKAGSATGCSQTPGLAIGCELLVFNVASATNPIFVAGYDVDGSTSGTGNLAILDLAVSGNALYVAKAAAGTTVCANTTGAGAAACELMVFNISSSTNPLYTKGLDATGSNAGTSTLAINRLLVSGNNLYVAKAGSSTPCSQVAGLAGGCEFMIFSLSSTTDPVYLAGVDADGNTAGVTATAATGLAISSTTLYLSKTLAGATACTTQANCELMVFNVASSTNPLYVTGIDASGNAAGAQSVAINNIAVSGSQLYAVKTGGGTTCSNTAGSAGAAACELMVFNISSTTNVIYRAGVDVTGTSNAGTGNQNVSSVVATGSIVYIVKSGTAAPCSQITGSALGCELMVFDASSSTNPVYVAGRDADGTLAGQTATVPQAIFNNNSSFYVGKASETTVCELEIGLRTGCELMAFTLPTSLQGTLTSGSGFATVTTNGLTQLISSASTTNLTITPSSQFTAPTSSLSISGDLNIAGVFAHNRGELALTGTNQRLTASATTTFYDFKQIATAAATTTFSTSSPFVIERNLTLQGLNANTPLRLRSASTTAQWKINPQSTTTISLAFIDVQDSNNVSVATTTLVCLTMCQDSGNNTNWSFPYLPVWNATDWTQYDTITISSSSISANLTDFPVYVDLKDLSNQFWSTIRSGGSDIRVTTVGNTEVPREVVSASTTIKTGELYFKAPTISSSTNTIFKIWYNGTTTPDYGKTTLYGSANVWTNDFVAVYHLEEDPSAGVGAIKDSTIYNQVGTGSTTMTSADSVVGKNGRSLDFDGALTDVVSFATSTRMANLSTLNVCTWYQYDSYIGSYGILLDKSSNGSNSWAFYLDTIGQVGMQSITNGFKQATYNPTGSWDYLCSANNGASGEAGITLYKNGSDIGGAGGSGTVAIDDSNVPLSMGAGKTDYMIDGRMDEVRIASTTRSTAWMRAEYLNQSTTSNFYIVDFPYVVGSSTLANHTAGQVSNAFTSANKTNEALLAFRLIPNSGVATVTNMVIDVTGISNVIGSDFTNISLLRDIDNDAQYDVTDVAVGGVGNLSINGSVGTITFTGDFLSTTSQNYIIVADFNAPSNGSFMTFNLVASAITVVDNNTIHEVSGNITRIQHSRNNKGGGGGGNSSVGGSAPAGNGDVGGGTTTGGELIGNNPDFFLPTSNAGSWTNPANAYDGVDNTYATTNSVANQNYNNHGFGVPTGNTIGGIEIKLELSGSTAAGTVDVQLSWDGGSSWTSIKSTPTLTTTDVVRTIGSPSDLWGRVWSAGDFSNANFVVRLSGNPSSNTVRVDAIQVRVYHLSSGGGAGGGSGGGGI